MSVIRVAVIEDQLQTRQMLSILINGAEGFECVAMLDSGEDAVDTIPRLDIDVALVDIHLPGGMSGTECVAALKPLCPKTEFLMCTSLEDADNIFAALKAGASGYLTKSTEPDKILDAIKDAAAGGAPMSSQIARKVINHFHAADPGPRSQREIDKLSVREQEILNHLARGYRYKEIASLLYLSIETVRKHIHNIYEKLQVNSRTDALNKVFEGRSNV